MKIDLLRFDSDRTVGWVAMATTTLVDDSDDGECAGGSDGNGISRHFVSSLFLPQSRAILWFSLVSVGA